MLNMQTVTEHEVRSLSLSKRRNHKPQRYFMKGYIYILLCSNGQYYTGSTNNIKIRLVQHQNGEGSNYTKKHLPVELVYVEEFDNIKDAFYREKQIQGWSRKKKEALINGEYSKLLELSKKVPSTGSGTTPRQAQEPENN
jgi:putative endonuclease